MSQTNSDTRFDFLTVDTSIEENFSFLLKVLRPIAPVQVTPVVGDGNQPGVVLHDYLEQT